MNLRSVFLRRPDAKRFDEEHAGDGGREERDEQHEARRSNRRSGDVISMNLGT
jgi:hypothetical protein